MQAMFTQLPTTQGHSSMRQRLSCDIVLMRREEFGLNLKKVRAKWALYRCIFSGEGTTGVRSDNTSFTGGTSLQRPFDN
jgi:hypothetical protein